MHVCIHICIWVYIHLLIPGPTGIIVHFFISCLGFVNPWHALSSVPCSHQAHTHCADSSMLGRGGHSALFSHSLCQAAGPLMGRYRLTTPGLQPQVHSTDGPGSGTPGAGETQLATLGPEDLALTGETRAQGRCLAQEHHLSTVGVGAAEGPGVNLPCLLAALRIKFPVPYNLDTHLPSPFSPSPLVLHQPD